MILTTYTDDASILEALEAGARGYLTKDAGRAQIALALRAAAAGQAMLDPGVQERLLARARGAAIRRPRRSLAGRPDGPRARGSRADRRRALRMPRSRLGCTSPRRP